MKDLDRLLNALVQDAESIPDIPYHAREDSLPFSYGMPGQAALKQRQEQQERLTQHQHTPHHRQPPSQQSSYQSPTPRYTTSSTYSYSAPPTSATYYSSPTSVQPPNSAPPHAHLEQRDFLRQTSRNTERDLDHVFLEDFPDSSPYSRPQFGGSGPSSSSQLNQSQPRVHNLRLDLDDQIIPNPHSSSRQPASSAASSRPQRFINDYSSNYGMHRNLSAEPARRYQPDIRENSYGERTHFYSPPPQQPPTTSLSFNNFSNVYGNGSSGTGKRMRSQSADGRRPDRDEDADQWLARQMQRLQEKKARKYPV